MMRYKTLKTVVVVVVSAVIGVAVAVSLVRKYVIPAPSGEQHGRIETVRTVCL